MSKKIILTTLFESELYQKDNEFEKEYATQEEADFEKDNYYSGDFWNNTSFLKDNLHGIIWNIYIDKENNEVIFNSGIETDENGDTEVIEFDSTYQKNFYDKYQELFEAQKINDSETEHFREVNNMGFNGDGSPTPDSDSNKADYVLKILGNNGNYYGFWEYNTK